jgi:hypothetical protein
MSYLPQVCQLLVSAGGTVPLMPFWAHRQYAYELVVQLLAAAKLQLPLASRLHVATLVAAPMCVLQGYNSSPSTAAC